MVMVIVSAVLIVMVIAIAILFVIVIVNAIGESGKPKSDTTLYFLKETPRLTQLFKCVELSIVPDAHPTVRSW